MLPKKHRLSKSAEVKKTTAKGRSFFNPYFVAKHLKGEGQPKVTVIVSTKVSKKAVTRNLLKRIIRDEIKLSINKLGPGSYAFIVKPSAATISTAELRKQIQTAIAANKALK